MHIEEFGQHRFYKFQPRRVKNSAFKKLHNLCLAFYVDNLFRACIACFCTFMLRATSEESVWFPPVATAWIPTTTLNPLRGAVLGKNLDHKAGWGCRGKNLVWPERDAGAGICIIWNDFQWEAKYGLKTILCCAQWQSCART